MTKKALKYSLIFMTLFASLNAMAFDPTGISVTGEFGGTTDGQNNAGGVVVSLPVVNGKVQWDIIGGITNYNTKSGVTVEDTTSTTTQCGYIDDYGQEYCKTTDSYIRVPDGSATYVSIGIGGKFFLFNRKDIDTFIRAKYNQKISGTSMDSAYSMATGKIYDPNTGVSVEAGVEGIIESVNLGLSLEDNVNSNIKTLKISLGYTF